MNTRYSVILGNLGNTCDRFLSTGYKEQPSKSTMIAQAAGIESVGGIELVGNWDVDEENADAVRAMLNEHNLACVSIIPDLFSRKKWGRGSLCSPDRATRDDAVAEVKKMTDIAVRLDCRLINLWPGQDGYDYALCADYLEDRRRLMDGLHACAVYAADRSVDIALEFKVKEPRTHSYLARTADTLLVVRELGLSNMGVCIDTGHSFMAYENVGESIALLKQFGNRLFHMHFNDNHSSWDDDMIVGSVRLVEYVEILYWLRKTGYTGWRSMDQYPYREDGCGAISASVLFLRKLERILDVHFYEIEQLVQARSPVQTARFVREGLIAA